jgi:VanZ family protein
MFIKYNLFAFLWAMLILFLSLMPGKEIPEVEWWNIIAVDKAIHVFFYMILVVLLFIGFYKQYTFRYLRTNCIKIVLLVGIVYGVIIEFIQSQIVYSGRFFEIGDVAANVSGCFIGWGIFFLVYKL